MTKFAHAGEMMAHRIKKGKKASRNALKKNFFSLVLCWFLTEVVAFAAWGVFVFIDFAGFFLGVPLDFFGSAVAIFIVFPMLVGNVVLSKNILKGRKASVYQIFDGYFQPRRFWIWALCYAVSVAPSWSVTAIIGAFSKDTGRIIPFLKGDWLIYVSVVLEVLTVVAFFQSLCKSLYFLLNYQLPSDIYHGKMILNKAISRYSKRKKYFRRYTLAHLHLIVIMILSRMFPLYCEAVVFAFVLGYFTLSISSFSEGFELKFKKYKSERS